MANKDDFASSVTNTFPADRGLSSSYPGSQQSGGLLAVKKWQAKYARFILDETGNEALETIMTDIVNGKYLAGDEKWATDQEGNSIVTLKYFIPVDVPTPTAVEAIPGRRRQRKALKTQEEK